MSSMRFEIEKTVCLRFPEKNGEAMIRFEESMEIPRAAETLMRGYYRYPDRIKHSFQELYAETSSLVEILLPRRSKLHGWSEELPERPQAAEVFLRESAKQLNEKEKRLALREEELLSQLQEILAEDIFPVSVAAFGYCSYREGSVKIFLKPLGRLAELLQLNPDLLRQVLRIYYLYLLLILTGLDLDGMTFTREEDEKTTHLLAKVYTWRYLRQQSKDLVHYLTEWLRICGEAQPPPELLADRCAEKLRTSTIFWRRQACLSWDECWRIVNKLDKE